MSNSEYDPFAGETGLKSDYDGEVIDAFFAAGTYGMQLNLKVKDVDTGEEDDKMYGTGPDWGSFDGGETVEHPKGSNKGFNNQTAIFELISAAFAGGAEEELRRRSREELGGKGPKAAALWKGMVFHWEAKTETKSYVEREGDNAGKRMSRDVTRILPTKFLRAGKVNTTGDNKPVAPGQTTTAAAGGSGLSLSDMDLPGDQQVQIKVKAQTLGYGDWVDFVMTLPNALENGTLMTAIGDEKFYSSLKGDSQ